MAKKKKTRQANREYRERIRKSGYRAEVSDNMDMDFRVVPRSGSGREQMAEKPQKKRPTGQRQQPVHSTKQKKSSKPKKPSVQKKRPKTPEESSRQKKRPEAAAKQTRKDKNIRSNSAARMSAEPAKRRKREEEFRARQQKKSVKQKYFDYTLVFIVIFLMLFGLLMLYTASIYKGGYFRRQCIFGLAGAAVMFVCSKIDYHLYVKKPILILILAGSIVSIFLVKTPLGVNLNGASRWVKIGPLQFQPAEIFKIGIILLNACLVNKFSHILNDKKNNKKKKYWILFFFLLMAALEMVVVLGVTDNLSSGLIIAMITVLMIFVAYPGYAVFIGGIVGLGAFVAGYVRYVLKYGDPEKYFRHARIFAWLAPEKLEDQSKVYQTTQALYSIGSGGLWGKGLGAGTQKMILPEAMNDMIFAIICEELGMVGAFLVLVMFAVLLYRLMFIAKNSKDLLGGMIVTGIFAHFMLQVILNVGVVTNLFPSTGVTLPFISYGGTALILLMAEVGIALNVSRQIDFEIPKLVRRKKQKIS